MSKFHFDPNFFLSLYSVLALCSPLHHLLLLQKSFLLHWTKQSTCATGNRNYSVLNTKQSRIHFQKCDTSDAILSQSLHKGCIKNNTENHRNKKGGSKGKFDSDNKVYCNI